MVVVFFPFAEKIIELRFIKELVKHNVSNFEEINSEDPLDIDGTIRSQNYAVHFEPKYAFSIE